MPDRTTTFANLALAAVAAVEAEYEFDSDLDVALRPQHQVQRPGRAPQLVIPYEQHNFDLDEVDDAICQASFRFSKGEIRSILPYMRMDLCEISNRYQPSSELAFCIFLARLSYPNRLKDHIHFFGRSRSYISSVFADVVLHITKRFRRFMMWDATRLNIQTLRRYVNAIGEENIWAFIDGTTVRVSRPGEYQNIYFSGHKRYHAIKYQAVVTPDGILSSLGGPVEASKADWSLYKESGLERIMTRFFDDNELTADDRMYIYGDPAYSGSIATMGAYKRQRNGELTLDEAWTNLVMSKKRMAVEHFFAHVQRYWKLPSYHLQNRLGNQPVGSVFLAACLMANCITCLRGNQISQYFRCPAPTLEEYFGGV